jgi:hypothetical protein
MHACIRHHTFAITTVRSNNVAYLDNNFIYHSPIHSGQIAAAQNGDPHDNAYADRLGKPPGRRPHASTTFFATVLDSSHRQLKAAPTAMQGPGGE